MQTDKHTGRLSVRNAGGKAVTRNADRQVGGHVFKQKCKQTDVGKAVNEKCRQKAKQTDLSSRMQVDKQIEITCNDICG
jgi:hypothetical protein